jgi:hypothetical protein
MLIEGLAGLLGKRLEIGALRASHGLFAGGLLVGVFEHVALWGLFLGLLIGHGITCYLVRERVPTKSRTPLAVDRPRTSEFLGASVQPRRYRYKRGVLLEAVIIP